MQTLGATDTETALQLARVIGSSMARIAEAELVPGNMVSSEIDPVMSAEAFAGVADVTLPAMAKLLEYVWRRQLAAGIQRSMLLRSHGLAPGQSPVLAVGFADMVGFTTLSQQLSEPELAAVVARFEEVAHDTVTGGGGRVVKMIGDEAMFVADSVPDDELLSDVRVALAVGPVLVQDGDFYGPVVNLASRAVNMAAPGAVIVTDEFHAALETATRSRTGAGHPLEFAFVAVRPRRVKDLGRVQLWVLYRPGAEPVALDRRLGGRWERLTDVLLDLDELREKGERLITGARPGPGDARGEARGGSGGGAERRDPEGPEHE
jgi:adenylate cyclase